MTSQTRDLALAQIKEFNTTLVSFHQYLAEAEAFHRTHLGKVDTMRAYIQTAQKEMITLYKMVKTVSVEEDEVN